jgi:hypothetical protein
MKKNKNIKKLMILSIAALMCLGALAVLPSASAATTRFADGFESYFAGGSVFPPTGWTIYNVDGGDPWVAYSGSAHTGTYSARCYCEQSYYHACESSPILRLDQRVKLYR